VPVIGSALALPIRAFGETSRTGRLPPNGPIASQIAQI
jgi:hypothetical protein